MAQHTVRALVVEDDFLIREMIIGYLEDLEHLVVGWAENGRQAVEQVQALKPDVVVMDIKMPDMDGIEAAHQIYALCPTPIVILTAYETPELLQKTSDAGVGAYLIKPSNPPELDRAITIAQARFDDLRNLRRLNQELQRRNEDLAAFSHTVSRDLQDLLQVVGGFAEVLDQYRDTLEPDEFTHCVQSIVSNVNKMGSITRELMLLAEVRKTKTLARPLEQMSDIVTHAQERLAHLIAKRQAAIVRPVSWPVALGYAPWVEEVWLNYLSNAIIYGGNPPEVELGATALDQKMIKFWVQDNGPGIPPEVEAQLFVPFDDATQVKLEGNGLGLAIARRIIEKLDGRVGVESSPGEGSRFWFTLPAF